MGNAERRKAKRASAPHALGLSKARLEALVEEATVDACHESEQAVGLFTMIERTTSGCRLKPRSWESR